MDDGSLTQYGNKSYVRAAIGSQPEGTTTFPEILKADGGVPDKSLSVVSDYRPKAKGLPYEVYYDPKYVELERDKLWMKEWQVAARTEDIPNVGDRIGYDVGTLSFLIVHTAPNEFRAFHNTCRHRGRRLCADKKENGDVIQCPFHGWAWKLDGKLLWVSQSKEFPGVTDKNFSLREVKCEVWGGNIFINPDLNAEPLTKALGVLVEHFKEFPVEDRYTAVRIKKKMRINWKLGQEAFLEPYHVIATHPSGMPMFGSIYTQIDSWDDGHSHVNRLITPTLVPDAWVKDKVSPRVGLELFCNAYGFSPPPANRGATVSDARMYAADCIRDRIKQESGRDQSQYSVAYMLDMVQWFMYPNFFPWYGEGMAWWYVFTPIGNKPDESIMEIRLTKPIPKNGPRPPAAPIIEIDFDEWGRDHPESGILGLIMDEDMVHMEEMQRGAMAARPDSAHAVLSTYLEDRVRHFQAVYAKKMGIK